MGIEDNDYQLGEYCIKKVYFVDFFISSLHFDFNKYTIYILISSLHFDFYTNKTQGWLFTG